MRYGKSPRPTALLAAAVFRIAWNFNTLVLLCRHGSFAVVVSFSPLCTLFHISTGISLPVVPLPLPRCLTSSRVTSAGLFSFLIVMPHADCASCLIRKSTSHHSGPTLSQTHFIVSRVICLDRRLEAVFNLNQFKAHVTLAALTSLSITPSSTASSTVTI